MARTTAHSAGLSYWASMQSLIDGPLDELIAVAKVKHIPLDALRAVAVHRSELAGQSSDAGVGRAAAYWSELIRLMDGN